MTDDFEKEIIYTELQQPSCSSVSNSESSLEYPNSSLAPFLLSLEDQNRLKEILFGWNMEYLYETCLGKY